VVPRKKEENGEETKEAGVKGRKGNRRTVGRNERREWQKEEVFFSKVGACAITVISSS